MGAGPHPNIGEITHFGAPVARPCRRPSSAGSELKLGDVLLIVRIHGDTAVVWGAFTEEFQITGLPSEVVRVRFSNTAVKRNGDWHFIWSHRDAQDFDDDGRYLRRPVVG